MNLFNYNTLQVTPHPETKSFTVELNAESERLTQEMLYELETLCSWLANHIEINSVLFTSGHKHFLLGINEYELANMDNVKFQKTLQRVQKLTHALFYLPQTIIFDLKNGVANLGVELSIAADVRIMNDKGFIHFNHLLTGFAPSSGGISLAGMIFNKTTLRSWLMTSEKIDFQSAKAGGFIFKGYTTQSRKEIINNLFRTVSIQAPVQRIQAKRTFLQEMLPEIQQALQTEKDFAQAGIITQDWKANAEGRNFLSAQEFSDFLQRTEEQEQAAN